MALQIVNGMAIPTVAGNTYFVKKASDPDYGLFVGSHLMTYNDGTQSVYNTVQAAHDAIKQATGAAAGSTTHDRGDMILVCPPTQRVANPAGGFYNQKINENAYIIIPGLKIFALAPNWESQWRASDATTKYPYTPTGGTATSGVCLIILARSVEVAGFLFDGGGGYGGVYVGDGYNVTGINALGYTNQNSAGVWIHDCYFQGGGEGNYGIQLDGCSADVKVERCVFNKWAQAGIYLTPGGSRTCQQPIIRDCDFWAANTAYGVDMYSSATTVGALVDRCRFRDGSGAAFTYGVRFQGAGVHTCSNSNFACTNKISAAATDFVSGNMTVAAGNSPNYLSVA